MGLSNVFIIMTVAFTALMFGNFVFLKWGKRFRVQTAERYMSYSQHSLGSFMRE